MVGDAERDPADDAAALAALTLSPGSTASSGQRIAAADALQLRSAAGRLGGGGRTLSAGAAHAGGRRARSLNELLDGARRDNRQAAVPVRYADVPAQDDEAFDDDDNSGDRDDEDDEDVEAARGGGANRQLWGEIYGNHPGAITSAVRTAGPVLQATSSPLAQPPSSASSPGSSLGDMLLGAIQSLVRRGAAPEGSDSAEGLPTGNSHGGIDDSDLSEGEVYSSSPGEATSTAVGCGPANSTESRGAPSSSTLAASVLGSVGLGWLAGSPLQASSSAAEQSLPTSY